MAKNGVIGNLRDVMYGVETWVKMAVDPRFLNNALLAVDNARTSFVAVYLRLPYIKMPEDDRTKTEEYIKEKEDALLNMWKGLLKLKQYV